MQAEITNSSIIIKDYSQDDLDLLNGKLSYTDKAKQYQIKRMMKNPFQRGSAYVKKLQKEVNQSLVKVEQDQLIIPSGFELIVKDLINTPYNEKRQETGAKIAVPWVKKPYDLRDYQEEAVSLMLNNWRGIINFATGLGKTLTAVHYIRQFKRNTLIVCPGESIASQFYTELCNAFGKDKIGFYGDGKKKINHITVGIAASVNKNLDTFKKANFGCIIFDEVHHIAATTFFSIAESLGSTGRMFGLTATDYRQDGKDIMITAGCGPVLIKRDMVWGVKHGWLAEPYFIVREIKTDGHDFKDDKLKNYKAHILNCQEMRDQIESDMKRMIAAGKSVLCLVDEVSHGEELSKALGLPFATGKDPKSQDYVDQLNAGKVSGLIGTDSKIAEGTDTRRVDVLILANFAAGKGPVIQALGRGLRKYGNKTMCIILDYIPTGSTMLTRHAHQRISYYQEISDKIKIITV
jgi:superfamily II DNA or RNA helicase